MAVSFRTKLLASHAAVALAVSAVTLLVVQTAVFRGAQAMVDRRLEAQARAVGGWMEWTHRPDRLAHRLAGVVGARVTFIDGDGETVGDSLAGEGSLKGLDLETDATEVKQAQAGNVGRATRYSDFEQQQVRYVAVPVSNKRVIRLALPIGEIQEISAKLLRNFGFGAIASLIVAVALAALVAGPLTRRLRDLTLAARRIGAGDYDINVAPQQNDEIGLLNNTLAAAASELKAIDQQRREFLATVAHEIRTPVTSIRGYAQTLINSEVTAQDRDEFLKTIYRNSVRVGQLVDDLLELEALQAGKSRPLDAKSVKVEPIAHHVEETLQARATQNNATLVVTIPPTLAATGDPDAIERILLNLTENALTHGREGVHITLEGRTEGEQTIISVSNDGPAIPKDQLQFIFERFHRGTKNRHPTQIGTGLGLPIARELAQTMGGDLTAHSDGERGATFELTLPA